MLFLDILTKLMRLHESYRTIGRYALEVLYPWKWTLYFRDNYNSEIEYLQNMLCKQSVVKILRTSSYSLRATLDLKLHFLQYYTTCQLF